MTVDQSHLTATERRIWDAWHNLPEAEPAPVKTIAAQLDMTPADVAFVVYPAELCGPWADWQEPESCCRAAILDRREQERPEALETLLAVLEGIDEEPIPETILDGLTSLGYRLAREWEPAHDDEDES